MRNVRLTMRNSLARRPLTRSSTLARCYTRSLLHSLAATLARCYTRSLLHSLAASNAPAL